MAGWAMGCGVRAAEVCVDGVGVVCLVIIEELRVVLDVRCF